MSLNRPGTCIMAGMRLSARADYALRAAIELAAAPDGHVTAEQLAHAQNIPGKFLETILTQLRRAGPQPARVGRRLLAGPPGERDLPGRHHPRDRRPASRRARRAAGEHQLP